MEEYIIEIDSDYITLSQLLKGAGIISTGGQAKAYLANQDIFIDGEQDQRRGRKIYPGSQVAVPNINATFNITNLSPQIKSDSIDTPEN